jgi:hypothetical protein
MGTVTDFRALIGVSDADAASALAMAKAADLKAAQAEQAATAAVTTATASRIDLGKKTLTFNTLVWVSIDIRPYSINVPGARLTDHVVAYKDGVWPPGFAICGPGYVSAADTVVLDIKTPTVGLGSTGLISLPLQFFAQRPPA